MSRNFTITISLLAALAAALGWPEILCFATTADTPLRLSNSYLALSFDRRTGAWTGLTDVRSNEELVAGPVTRAMVVPLPKAELDKLQPAVITEARQNSSAALTMTARSDTYEYRMEYRLPDGQAWFSRQLIVRNVSAATKVVEDCALATPPMRVGPGQTAAFPGSVPLGDTPVAGIAKPEGLRPPSKDPLAVLWDASSQRGLGTWYHCEEEYSPVSVRRAGEGAEIQHLQHIIVRLKPGEAVTLGKQFFWVAHGSRDAVLAGVQQVYRSIDLRAPPHGLSNLAAKVLYCGHPGGTFESHFRGYGGFAALRRYLPTLKKMGIDLFWLMPIWEHSDKDPWNLYRPSDHFRISPLYGTPDELRELSAACAEDGIRLLFDLVPHGPPDSAPLAKEHPEWIGLDPQGKPRYAWKTYAFDNAHPGWQDYMRRVAQWDAQQYGAIGSRVDCGGGGPLNWNPAVGNRPSLSSLAGGLGMDRAIREGFLKVNREVVVVPEEYSGATIFYRVADLTYDAQFYYLMTFLQAGGASPEKWAWAFQQFLHDQQLTLPPGALKMRWISTHDTVAWLFQKRRPLKIYGPQRMRALLAICALIEGVPMLYQGDEDPAIYGGRGDSSVEFLARIYGLRKRLPAIGTGKADYMGVRASGGVFACLREAPTQQAAVLVSLNPQPVESTVSLPASAAGRWRDALSGELLQAERQVKVAMGPCQVRVLVR